MADLALSLNLDRFLPPDPAERTAARPVFEDTHALPVVSPHGHVDPGLLARDKPFPELTALLVTPNHYVFRMLHRQGVPLDALGIPRAKPAPAQAGGTRADVDPRAVWQTFCAHWHLFSGTPSRAWMEYELHELFGVRVAPSRETAGRIYDQIAECPREAVYRPRALFERFGIETLATTDAATDALADHAALDADGWNPGPEGHRVIPTFRPDALVCVAHPDWPARLGALESITDTQIGTYDAFDEAHRARRMFFRAMGAVATDHSAETAQTGWLPDAERDAVFACALATPIFLPVVVGLGLDPVHFGIVMTLQPVHRAVHTAGRERTVRRRCRNDDRGHDPAAHAALRRDPRRARVRDAIPRHFALASHRSWLLTDD